MSVSGSIRQCDRYFCCEDPFDVPEIRVPIHVSVCEFLADDDVRFDSAFVEDLADRRADDAFDPQPLLFFDRRLHSAELDEVLRFDDSEHLDAAVGFGCAAGGEAQCNARLGAVVDHDEIGAFDLVPHAEPSAALNPQ